MMAHIGKIVKSNTHIDYVCQVYNPGETQVAPQPVDYAFGAFVAIHLDDSGSDEKLVGVIYNTLLMNPDFGNLGPRLSPRHELEIFTPDYLAETAMLVGVIALGWIDGDGAAHQGVPPLAAAVNNPVVRMADEQVSSFHRDPGGRICLRYMPVLLNQNDPLAPQLLMSIIDRLSALFPNEQRQLAVMRNNLAWKSIVQPAG